MTISVSSTFNTVSVHDLTEIPCTERSAVKRACYQAIQRELSNNNFCEMDEAVEAMQRVIDNQGIDPSYLYVTEAFEIAF